MIHGDLIRLARRHSTLVEASDEDPSAQIELRAAVRCADCALFHMLSQQCADLFAGQDPDNRSTRAWVQAYRSLQHGTVRSRCANNQYITEFPPGIMHFAEKFVQMRSRRHLADYDPQVKFDSLSVTVAVEEVALAIAAFETISEKHRRAFAVYVTSPLNRQLP